MAPVGELGVNAVLDGNEPEQFEAGCLILQESARLGVRQRVPAPKTQGFPQHRHRVDPVVGLLRLHDEIGEPVDVDGVTRQRHAVPGGHEFDQ